jgi:Phage integrase, N-terminal SAM-like domain
MVQRTASPMSTGTISPLRQRMIGDMTARKLCAATQTGHIRSCKRFATFLKRSPDTATAEDLRQFQLHLAETGVGICNRNRIAATGYPGYDSVIGRDNATIGRILLENGCRTAWFGKDHNAPTWTASQVGPFDQWPTGMGFEYFYGFIGGDTTVGTEPISQHHSHLSIRRGAGEMEPDHRDGG